MKSHMGNMEKKKMDSSPIRENPLAALQPAKSVNARTYSYKHRPNEFINLAVFKRPLPKPDDSRSGIRQVFLDVSMVNHIEGLQAIAKKRGVDPGELEPGDFLLFINPAGTYAKLLGPRGAVVSIKSPRGQLSPLLLQALPTFFKGKAFDYDAQLRPILEHYLVRRSKERVGALKAQLTKNLAD